jgi:hypothetical protein
MRKLETNLDIAAEFLVSDIVKAFPSGGDVGTRAGGGNASNHSKPGGIPFVQTGSLKEHMDWEREGRLTRLIGSTLKPEGDQKSSYALYLELGTPNGQMEPRPFLRPALDRNADRLKRIILQ